MKSRREKFKKDYEGLLATLSTLPDKVQHDIMVPVGSVGFFPGKLIHTNEVMVLLGENWFAQRSAKQASEIVQRRLQYVDKNLEELEQEHDQLKSQLDFTQAFEKEQKEIKELVEIREEIPDDTESSKTERKRVARQPNHDKVPKTFKHMNSVETPRVLNVKSTSNKTDKELFKRLEELEREEEELASKEHEAQIEKLSNENVERTKRVSFMDESLPKKFSKDSGYIDSDGESNSDDEAKKIVRDSNDNGFIKFSHSDVAVVNQSDDSVECQGEKGFNPPSEIDNPGDNKLVKPAIISPADIYEKFAKISKDTDERPLKPILKEKRLSSENIKLKSILKTSPEHKPYAPDNGVIEKALEEPKSILKTGQDAFSGVVVERETDPDKETASKEEPLKPVSRFKASRMKKK